MKLHGIAATLLFVFLGLDAAIAGPCKADIDAEQAKIDAALDQVAKAGKTGVESTAATERRQPTPASIAAAACRTVVIVAGRSFVIVRPHEPLSAL